MKPSLRKDPNHIILHVGTNDLILDRTSQDIATSIVNLACSIKDDICHVSISNIILKDMCKEKNIYLINNTNKIKAQHLNKGKLHLNKRGSNILSSTFVSELSRILTWQRHKNNTGFTVEELTLIKQMLSRKLQMATEC